MGHHAVGGWVVQLCLSGKRVVQTLVPGWTLHLHAKEADRKAGADADGPAAMQMLLREHVAFLTSCRGRCFGGPHSRFLAPAVAAADVAAASYSCTVLHCTAYAGSLKARQAAVQQHQQQAAPQSPRPQGSHQQSSSCCCDGRQVASWAWMITYPLTYVIIRST